MHHIRTHSRAVLTPACIHHIPPRLRALDISPVSDMEESDMAPLCHLDLLQSSLPWLSAAAAQNLPYRLEQLVVHSAYITSDMLAALPKSLCRLHFQGYTLLESESLQFFPEKVNDLKPWSSLSRGRMQGLSQGNATEHNLQFEDFHAKYIPASVTYFSLTTTRALTDAFWTHFFFTERRSHITLGFSQVH